MAQVEPTRRAQADDVALVAAAYEAFARRDLHRLGELLTADVVFRCPGPRGTLAGNARADLLDGLARIINLTDGTATAELLRVDAMVSGGLVCVHHETARWAGVRHDAVARVVLIIESSQIALLAREPFPG